MSAQATGYQRVGASAPRAKILHVRVFCTLLVAVAVTAIVYVSTRDLDIASQKTTVYWTEVSICYLLLGTLIVLLKVCKVGLIQGGADTKPRACWGITIGNLLVLAGIVLLYSWALELTTVTWARQFFVHVVAFFSLVVLLALPLYVCRQNGLSLMWGMIAGLAMGALGTLLMWLVYGKGQLLGLSSVPVIGHQAHVYSVVIGSTGTVLYLYTLAGLNSWIVSSPVNEFHGVFVASQLLLDWSLLVVALVFALLARCNLSPMNMLGPRLTRT